MRSLRKMFDATMLVAGIVFLTIEVWRDRTNDYKLPDFDLDVPAGPPGPFAFDFDDPEVEHYLDFTSMMPLFSTRPALRMVS